MTPPGVIIEPARPTDTDACALILSDWIDETGWIPRIHTREQEHQFVADLIGRGWVTVARQCGAPVGFLARDGQEIHALYLSRPVRGKGIGKALVDRAKAASGVLTLYTFTANQGAQAFYLREGFREIGHTDGATNDEKLPDIRYRWERRRNE